MANSMSLRPFTHELVDLRGGLKLEASLSCPYDRHSPKTPVPQEQVPSSANRKLAVCLHPWSWLGGNMDDPYVSLQHRDVTLLIPYKMTEYFEPLKHLYWS